MFQRGFGLSGVERRYVVPSDTGVATYTFPGITVPGAFPDRMGNVGNKVSSEARVPSDDGILVGPPEALAAKPDERDAELVTDPLAPLGGAPGTLDQKPDYGSVEKASIINLVEALSAELRGSPLPTLQLSQDSDQFTPRGDGHGEESFRRWFAGKAIKTRMHRGRVLAVDVFLVGPDGTTKVVQLAPEVRATVLSHRISEHLGLPLDSFYFLVDGTRVVVPSNRRIPLREASVIRVNLRVIGGSRRKKKVSSGQALVRAGNALVAAQTGVNLLKLGKETGLAKAYRGFTSRGDIPIQRSLRKRLKQPKIRHTSRGTEIEGEELVGILYGQIAFTTSASVTNSAGADVGGYLQVAVNNPYITTYLASFEDRFENVEWEVAQIEVDSTCPSTTQGGYYLGYQPDVDQARWTSEQEIAASGAILYGPFDSAVIEIDKARLANVLAGRKLYVQNQVSGSDSRLTEAGEFIIGTVGASANDTPFGKVYFCYKCILSNPIIQRPTPAFTCITVVNKNTTSQSLSTGVATAVNGWGNSSDVSLLLDGLKIGQGINSTTGAIYLPRGTYDVSWRFGVTRDNVGAMQLLGYFWDQIDGSGGATTQQINIQNLYQDPCVAGVTYIVSGFQTLRVGQDGGYFYLVVDCTFTGGTAVIPASTTDGICVVNIRGA